jgi:periplasmic copper chaperone A
MTRTAVFSSAALFLAACGGASEPAETNRADTHEAHAPDETPHVSQQQTQIDVRIAWMRPHPQGRDVTAAYIVVQLEAGTEDLFTGARIDGAQRVELHGHTMTADGMMQMRAIGPQRLAGEGPLVFAPGARHLMVFGLSAVAEGDSVPGVLLFQNAGEVPVMFEVRSMPPGLATDY